MNSRKRLKRFIVVFLISCTLICINGFYQSIVGHGFILGHIFDGRISSSFRHANDFGSYLLIIVPVLISLSFLTGSKRQGEEQGTDGFTFLFSPGMKIFYVILFILSLACLGLTYSRGAWIGFVLSLAMFGVINRRVSLFFILIIVVFLSIFYPKLTEKRIPIKDRWSFLVENNRLSYWRRASNIIKDYPVFGCGLNTYALVEGRYNVGWGGYPHNSYLQMAAETGLVGITFFLWMLFVLFRDSLRALKQIEIQRHKILLFGFTTGLLGFLIHSFFDTNFYSVQLGSLLWIIMGVIVALQKIESPNMVFPKRSAGYFDGAILTICTILITLHPYYLHGKLNLFELGIYLPGINSILDGQIPYRDFFHLRGPFELYIPAFFMHFLGKNISLLLSYFYVGTILTLIMCIILGKQLFTTRLFYYLAIPVLVARTFPRVVFTYWGGIRFALGLAAIACAVQYFKGKKSTWIFISGIIAACSFLTSMEIGIYVCIAVTITLILCALSKNLKGKNCGNLFVLFIGGFLAVGLPYGVYLHLNGALLPFLETTYNLAYNMGNVFPQVEAVPQNLGEAIFATLNPGSKNFKHLTPVYLYLFLTIYFIAKVRRGKLRFPDFSIVCLALYGFVLYLGSFRNIWSSNFEMALQPEKILLFILLERIFLFMNGRKQLILQGIRELNAPVFKKRLKVWAINICIGGVILSSIGYPIQRYNKRFFAFKYIRNLIVGKETDSLKPLHNIEKTKLDIITTKGLTVPDWQAKDFTEVSKFLHRGKFSQSAVLMYPEGAAYSFIVDKPFVGRFPMATFSWFDDKYHDEYMASLKNTKAKVAVIPKELPHYFDKTHFIVEGNKQKYDEVMQFINDNYELSETTPTLKILEWKTNED